MGKQPLFNPWETLLAIVGRLRNEFLLVSVAYLLIAIATGVWAPGAVDRLEPGYLVGCKQPQRRPVSGTRPLPHDDLLEIHLLGLEPLSYGARNQLADVVVVLTRDLEGHAGAPTTAPETHRVPELATLGELPEREAPLLRIEILDQRTTVSPLDDQVM